MFVFGIYLLMDQEDFPPHHFYLNLKVMRHGQQLILLMDWEEFKQEQQVVKANSFLITIIIFMSSIGWI